jgi:hypothetical protein
MYCPRCGQERFSEATSFCSRCGLLLDHIENVMANGGEPLEGNGKSGGRFFSRKNVRLFAALWFCVFVLFFTPISAILGADAEVIAVAGTMGSVGALIILIFSFFLPKNAALTARPVRRTGSIPSRENAGLPAPKTEFADDYIAPAGGRSSDAEPEAVRRPSSVTEETTRHLDKKRDA